MSRVGRKPVDIPKGVAVTVDDGMIRVKGPKGQLERQVPPEMMVEIDDGTVKVQRPSDSGRHRAMHGLARSLIANMVEGVTDGFSKALEIQGVGYRAETKPQGVRLVVGYSHPVEYDAPSGIEIVVETPTSVKVVGIDKEVVGQVAAELRRVRPPEPYKGKGIRYVGEQVRRKAGKTGGKA
jgi:large subunit ribosomal protein L6